MHDLREPHMTALKHILCYLQGTLDFGLIHCRPSTSELVVYSDTDWARCPDTRRSIFGYAVFLGDNLVSWSSKHQSMIFALAQKQNTELLPMVLRRLLGFTSYS
jgi:hypothetical protein